MCFAGAAYAQSGTTLVKVYVPFEFNFGGKTFPAGDYSVAQPLQDVLTLRNERGQTVASTFTIPTESSSSDASAGLWFSFSEGQHTLVEVQPGYGATGQQLRVAKSRMQLARQETVEIEAGNTKTRP